MRRPPRSAHNAPLFPHTTLSPASADVKVQNIGHCILTAGSADVKVRKF
jgi:hypothetical protein